jgi:hypothetical protein
VVLLVVIGAPILAGWAAAGRTDVAAAQNGQSAAAGLWTGGVAALVVTILTISTMLVFPGHVPLEWANPDPNVPHGTAFEIQMSVSDAAAKYLFVLLVGPLVGTVFGLLGVSLLPQRRPSN